MQDANDENQDLEHGLDFDFLKNKGIELLRKISIPAWNDFSVHDPGITILDQLCFSLMDMSYRTDFPMQHYLKFGEEEGSVFKSKQAIEQPRLTTIEDFERHYIDAIPAVKSCWIYPITNKTRPISGLFKLYVQGKGYERSDYEKLVHLVKKERLLGEDIEDIVFLEEVPLLLTIALKIEKEGEESTLMEVLQRTFTEFITNEKRNSIAFYNTPQNDDSPFFISKTALTEVILSLPSVISILSMEIQLGEEVLVDVVRIRENELPVVNFFGDSEGSSSVTFTTKFKNSYSVDKLTLRKLIIQQQLAIQEKKNDYTSVHLEEASESKSIGKFDYYSIQHDFPAVYGIGSYGISESSGPERRAQVKQLKGYLSLFEQVMATYFCQLSNLSTLLSSSTNHKHTGFKKSIESLLPFSRTLPKETIFTDQYSNENNGTSFSIVQKNSLLDYLLSIQGEDFKFSLENGYEPFYENETLENYLLSIKNSLAFHTYQFNRYCGKGYSTNHPFGWNQTDRKLALLLGIYASDESQFDDDVLSKLVFEQHSSIEIPNDADFIDLRNVSPIKRNDEASSSEFKYSPEYIQFGVDPFRYKIGEPTKGIYHLVGNFYSDSSKGLFLGQYNDYPEALVNAKNYLEKAVSISKKSERFYAVETILLRPSPESNHYGVYITNTNGEALLASTTLSSYIQLLDIIKCLKSDKKNKLNYSVQITDDRHFVLTLKISTSTIRFTSVHPLRSAEKTYLQLNELSTLTADNINVFISYDNGVTKIDANFFNHHVVFCMPSITYRFQRKNFQECFEIVSKKLYPIHLRLSYQWLELEAIQEFIALYDAYLKDDSNLEKRGLLATFLYKISTEREHALY